MRSSQKSGRSRGKGNRNKNVGHSPNRVYESAGPEGKVRGTPQQIIDKYLALARDAQLSGDRVGAENFLQHAEHYARVLIAAQEAADQRRDQQQNQSGQSSEPGQGGDERREARAGGEDDNNGQRRRGGQQDNGEADQPSSDGLAAIDAAAGGPDIVETPESKSKPKPSRPRRPRPKPPSDEPSGDAAPASETPAEAAE